VANAARRAEAIRSKIESLEVPYLGRNLPRITVSIGFAAFPNSGDNPQVVLRAADAALYKAKELGRNCVELSPTISAASGFEHGDAAALQRTLDATFEVDRGETVTAPSNPTMNAAYCL
jgi:predicted signal transduction protein with EAL and GGDEF domain